MATPFSFATAGEILFGRGQSGLAASRVREFGPHVLLVQGANGARADWLAAALSPSCDVVRFSVGKEPDLPLIDAGRRLARDRGAEVVVALGGGAVIDAGKAIAALVPATGDTLDYLEVVGRGLPLDRPPLPFVALPTTAGTGAEVTRNAVIQVPEHTRKVSLRDIKMLPRLAIVDPSLTDDCPRNVTLASGLDAITQVIEPYISTRANPFTDALCHEAIPRGLGALVRLMTEPGPAARDEMAYVSLCGGIALANAGLGAVHGLAGPLGGLSTAAHGAICGTLLPHVLLANRAATQDGGRQQRMDQVGAWIGAALGEHGKGFEAAVCHLADWSRQQGLPGLRALGIGSDIRQKAAIAAASSSSMKANPAELSAEQLVGIMLAAD